MYKKWKTGTALVLCAAMTLSQLSAVLAKDTASETAAEITSQENSAGQPSNEPPQAPPSGDMNGGSGGPGSQKPDGEPPQKPNGEMPDGPGQMGEGGPGEPGQMGAGGGPGGSSERTDGQLGSWSMGGTDASTAEGDDYAYDSALYITQEGINEENSDTNRVSDGTYDDSQADGITISDIESGHNGIIIYNTPYSISNAKIDLLTEADGSDTCDFSGKGAALCRIRCIRRTVASAYSGSRCHKSL